MRVLHRRQRRLSFGPQPQVDTDCLPVIGKVLMSTSPPPVNDPTTPIRRLSVASYSAKEASPQGDHLSGRHLAELPCGLVYLSGHCAVLSAGWVLASPGADLERVGE